MSTQVKTKAQRGGDSAGEITSLSGDVIVLLLTDAYAPGTPVSVRGDGYHFDFKCLRSRKVESGFEVRGQLRSVPKVQMDKLRALLPNN